MKWFQATKIVLYWQTTKFFRKNNISRQKDALLTVEKRPGSHVSLALTIAVLLDRLCLGNLAFTDGLTHSEVSHGSSDEERRQRTEDNTENHGEREAADRVTTEDEDTEQHNQGRH